MSAEQLKFSDTCLTSMRVNKMQDFIIFTIDNDQRQSLVNVLDRNHALVEVRTYDGDRNADRGYSVRDAATVTDEDVRNGKRPKQIAFFNFEDDAINFIKTLK